MIVGLLVAVTWAIGMLLMIHLIQSTMVVFALILWTMVCCGSFEVIDNLIHD